MTTDKYTKEPGYIYIETEEDRRDCAPKLVTDEFLYCGQWREVGLFGWMGDRFSMLNVYRRKVATVAGVGDWVPFNDQSRLPDGVNDDTHWVELLWQSGNRDVYIPSAVNALSPSEAKYYRLIPKVPAPATAANSQAVDLVEAAYYNWMHSDDGTDEPMDAWAAGVAWARKQAADE